MTNTDVQMLLVMWFLRALVYVSKNDYGVVISTLDVSNVLIDVLVRFSTC